MQIEIKYNIDGKTYTKSDWPECQLSSIEKATLKKGELRVINSTLFYAKYTRSQLNWLSKHKIVSWCMYNLPDNEDRKNKLIEKFYEDLKNNSTNQCYDKCMRTYY